MTKKMEIIHFFNPIIAFKTSLKLEVRGIKDLILVYNMFWDITLRSATKTMILSCPFSH